MAEADTIVFDKTGTLTKARPTVADVVSFNGETPDELLRTAACLEEHFPHSMAKAVVNAAMEKNLQHEEMHTKVEYVVAHGISTMINNKKVIIGSYHFVFEDEKVLFLRTKGFIQYTSGGIFTSLYSNRRCSCGSYMHRGSVKERSRRRSQKTSQSRFYKDCYDDR